MNTIPYGYVYRIVNTVNGKTYVGQHKLKNEPWRAYMGSGNLVRYAISKYGVERFVKQLLCYCDTKQSLDAQEKVLIDDEISAGRAQYNLNFNPSATTSVITATDTELLDMYFEQKMSLPQIAQVYKTSTTNVRNRLKKYKETDPRFTTISQGVKRGEYDYTSFIQAGVNGSKKTIPCSQCGRHIVIRNLERHEKSCGDYVLTKTGKSYKRVKNKRKNIGSKTCLHPDCNTAISPSSTYCPSHKNILVNTKESVRNGGIMSSHVRWHIKRNIVNPNCPVCPAIAP